MSFESGKNMASVGALLLVIGALAPFLSISDFGVSRLAISQALYTSVPVLSIAGITLLFMGVKNLAKYYDEKSIFSNARYAVIFGIIGMVAVGFFLLFLLFRVRLIGGQPYDTSVGFNPVGYFIGLILSLSPLLIVALVFYILMAVYFRKAFNSLASKSGETLFGTAGLLLLIGTVLSIIIIGLILIFIAWILLALASFSIEKHCAPTDARLPASAQTRSS